MKIKSHITAAALLCTLNFSANAGAKEAEAVIPQEQNSVYNLNIDWKYKRLQTASPLNDAAESEMKDGLNFYDPAYDDSDWKTVAINN